MMKAGVPLLQSFDIVAQGQHEPAHVASCSWTSRATSRPAPACPQAFRKYPLYFDSLFCNLVEAGEQAGILDALLDRLATYKEKILAIKAQDQVGAVLPDGGDGRGVRRRRGDHDLS
jgi:type IV pilus assembly protein PilC